MPRAYHSISSVKLGMRCQRAWALCYLAGIREPEIAWEDPKAPWLDVSRMTDAEKRRAYGARSKALGKATHAVFERWQTPGAPAPDWRSLPGEIALSGAHHVPHPERVHEARVEASIGKVTLPPSDREGAPRTAYELHGIKWVGYRDLLVSAPGEFVRLKINAPDGWALYDYKTTASIDDYALTPAGLATDPQACLYVAATCDELGLDALPVRWLYLETKKRRAATPVDACIRAHDAKNVMVEYAAKARELDQITDVDAARMNAGACGDYGGCYYHVSNGGPCNARPSLGGLIQARVPKKESMALDPATQAKFSQFKKNGASTPPAESAPEAPPAESAPEAPPAESAPEAPAATAPAKPRPGRKPAATAPVGGTAAKLAELTTLLGNAEAEREKLDASIAEIKAEIVKACA